jgi:hypothetical protein
MSGKPLSSPGMGKDTVNKEKTLLSLSSIVVVFIVAGFLFSMMTPDASGASRSIVSSIIATIVALIIAVIVTGIIFAIDFLYEDRIKKTYVDPLERTQQILGYSTSRTRVGVLSAGMLLWMVILYLWWKDVTVPAFDKTGAIIHVFSDQFASYILVIVLLGFAIIAVNVLYLAVSAKWVVSLAETALNACVLLLFYLLIQGFPFSSSFSPLWKAVIFMLLVFAFLVMALGVSRNLMQLFRLIRYNDGSWNKGQSKTHL